MNRFRLAYRTRQFWQSWRSRPDEEGLEEARRLLTDQQLELFEMMAPSEQAHALRVLERIRMQGGRHPDLLVAALLHDVGKNRYPLRLFEQVLVVLARTYFPDRMSDWGRGKPQGLRRALVIAKQHPYWGAEMAARAGASPLAVNLIWRHQESPSIVPQNLEDRLLRTLQAADDDS